MFDMEPGLNQIDNNEVVRALERLLYTPSFFGRYLNAARYPLLMTTFVMRKPLGEDAFMELAEFVAAQRS